MPTEICFTRPSIAVIGVDLDDLGVLRPVVEAVLRQRAEGPEARAEREHDVGLGDELHRRLRALVAERAAPQRVVGGESVVVQVAVDDRRLQILGERHGFLDAVRHDHAAAGEDHRELAPASSLAASSRLSSAPGPRADALRLRDLAVELAVEIVARDVELGRAALRAAPCRSSGR